MSEKFIRRLVVDEDAPEVIERRAEIAGKMEAIILEIERIKNLQSLVKVHQDRLTTLAHDYRDAARDDVECEWRIDDPEPGKKTCYRLDTHEAVETTDVAFEDVQAEIPFSDDPDDELMRELAETELP